MKNYEMTDRRRRTRPKVVPRAVEDFVQQLKIDFYLLAASIVPMLLNLQLLLLV